jgi:hypothetical protein
MLPLNKTSRTPFGVYEQGMDLVEDRKGVLFGTPGKELCMDYNARTGMYGSRGYVYMNCTSTAGTQCFFLSQHAHA